MRVQVVREERHSPRNEMRRLVDVVAVGQSLLDPPQAQQERAHEQDRQRGTMQVTGAGARSRAPTPRRARDGGAERAVSGRAGPGRVTVAVSMFSTSIPLPCG